MKELKLEFEGRGELKEFFFKQLERSDRAYIYELKHKDTGRVHYEIFKRRENYHMFPGEVEETFEPRVTYPSNESFGDWAWCIPSEERAYKKFKELNKE